MQLKPHYQELVLAWLLSPVWYAMWLHQQQHVNKHVNPVVFIESQGLEGTSGDH